MRTHARMLAQAREPPDFLDSRSHALGTRRTFMLGSLHTRSAALLPLCPLHVPSPTRCAVPAARMHASRTSSCPCRGMRWLTCR